MKIQEIKISGFRGFKSFSVLSSDLTGFTILAGQNGTGKSTILEIVSFILRNGDINTIDASIVNGVTADVAEWELTISFSESDIEYLAEQLKERNSNLYKDTDTLQLLKKELTDINGRYALSIKIEIPPEISPGKIARRLYKLNGEYEERNLQWLTDLSSLLVVDLKPLQDLSEGGVSIFGGEIREVQMNELTSTESDIRRRNVRTSVGLNNLLNRLALVDLWQIFQSQKYTFPHLYKALDKINKIITPLEIFFDIDQLEKGEISFKMKNNKIDRKYSLTFSSSGERQVIGLVATLVQWERQRFRPIVLIDEPDTHLHPEYSNKLADFMHEVFSSGDEFSCLVATHSPDFISANVENVYQIKTDSSSVEKVTNLEGRVKLLQKLGKKFDLAFLIPKLIYVEGVERSTDHIEDYKVYQRLVDPLKNKVVFLPAGSVKNSSAGGKAGAARASALYKSFLDAITQQGNPLDIHALIDKDLEPLVQKKTSVYVTPFTNLENIFLLDFNAISIASSTPDKQIAIDEIKKIMDKKESNASSNLLTINGKKHLKNIYNEISKASQDIKNLTYKGFQEKILSNINSVVFPKEVKDFFDRL